MIIVWWYTSDGQKVVMGQTDSALLGALIKHFALFAGLLLNTINEERERERVSVHYCPIQVKQVNLDYCVLADKLITK